MQTDDGWENVVLLQVGDTKYTTTQTSLTQFGPNSLSRRVDASKQLVEQNKPVLVPGNARILGTVLDFLQSPILAEQKMNLWDLLEGLYFYKINFPIETPDHPLYKHIERMDFHLAFCKRRRTIQTVIDKSKQNDEKITIRRPKLDAEQSITRKAIRFIFKKLDAEKKNPILPYSKWIKQEFQLMNYLSRVDSEPLLPNERRLRNESPKKFEIKIVKRLRHEEEEDQQEKKSKDQIDCIFLMPMPYIASEIESVGDSITSLSRDIETVGEDISCAIRDSDNWKSFERMEENLEAIADQLKDVVGLLSSKGRKRKRDEDDVEGDAVADEEG